MVFRKKLRWNMIFLVLSGKTIFLFTENMILHVRQTINDDLSQKKKKAKIWYFLQTCWKDGLFKKDRSATWFFLYYLERWYFFSRKHDNFSIGRKVRDYLSQEIHGNMIFSVYTCGRYKLCTTPFCQKKSKMVLSRKNTPEGDWRSRLTF